MRILSVQGKLIENYSHVCMCIYMCVCAYIYTHIYAHTHTYTAFVTTNLCVQGKQDRNNLDPETVRNLQPSPIISELSVKCFASTIHILLFPLHDYNEYMTQF